MAGNINKAILIGRLGQDPELRHTQSNMAVCNFSLATSETYKEQERTEWHRIVVWGRQAEIAHKYLAKGRLVYVEGRLQTREYNDRDGNQRRSTEIVARDIQFLGGRGEQDGMSSAPVQRGSMGSAPASSGGFSPSPAAPPANDFTEDDIPF